MQRELDAAGRRYVGSATTAATMAMDKDATKTLAVQLGIPTPSWELLHEGDDCTMPCPVVVKAPREGSSIDLFICRDERERTRRMKELLSRHRSIMVEQFISGRELTVGVVHEEALPIIEIIPATDSYDYEAKYVRDDTTYVLETRSARRGTRGLHRCSHSPGDRNRMPRSLASRLHARRTWPVAS